MSALAILVVAYQPAHAQTAAPAAENTGTEVTDLVVTGSRFGGRLITDSPTPMDRLDVGDLERTGTTDLQSALRTAVPSFSIPRPAASGAIDFLTPPTLRGLSTGQLLLLVNGKRRHTSSILNLGSVTGRGDVAYDFNAIPTLALSRIEVLRDGAAAQYGSDAISGVMNVVLDESIGGRGEARFGKTSEGDGADVLIGGSVGVGLGDGGSVRFTAQFQDHNKTNRALPDTRQQYLGSNGTTLPSANFGSGTGLTPSNGALDPREATIDRNTYIFGDPSYLNRSGFVNAKLPLGEAVEAYAFGGYNKLRGTSYNFFRRAGQDETVRSIYPNGYLPLQQLGLENFSAAGGLRGQDLGGFTWDLSSVYGGSIDDLAYSNSNNVSLGNASPTDFYRGGTRFHQWTNNLDLTREFDVLAGSPLKVAFGLEYRKESYDVVPGELNSYVNGGVRIIGGPNAGNVAPVGGQPGGGTTASEATSVGRNSKAVYAEIEQKLFNRLTLTGAARYEDFSDFGDTFNYKAAGRFEIVEGWSVRGSYGSGFRAPALAQSYFNQTNIVFVNGAPLRTRVVSVNDPVAPLIGASSLRPEKSKNLSLGTVVDFHGLTASFDYYKIAIDNRLAASSIFQSTGLTNLLAANGFPGLGGVSYVTNAVDTTTRGFDITARYRQDLGDWGNLATTLGVNRNRTRFDRIAGTPPALAAVGITTPLFDLTQQVRFKNSTPSDKISLNLNWTFDRFTIGLTNTRYGKVSQMAATNRTPAQVAALIQGYDVRLVPSAPGSANSDIIQSFGADIVTDLEASYRLSDRLTLSAGASNLFDKYPDKVLATTAATVAAGTSGSDNVGTLPYAIIAPYGFNGRFLYAKIGYKF